MNRFGAAELTDEVVRAAAEGSRDDLERVVQTLRPQVWLMVAARLSPTPAQHHAAEDVHQQAMLALTAGLPRLEHRTVGGLKAYASGVVRRQVAATIRRWGRDGGRGARRLRSIESRVRTPTHHGAIWEFLPASMTSPGSAADRAEQTVLLLSSLGSLKDSHRDVITLAFFDQLPTRAIATQMHMTQRAVAMLLLRAVRALRHRMRARNPATRCEAGHGDGRRP